MGKPRPSKHCAMTSCQRVGSKDTTQLTPRMDPHGSLSADLPRGGAGSRHGSMLHRAGLALAAAFLAVSPAAQAYELQEKPDYSRISPLVTKLLEREHFSRKEFNDAVSQGVLTEFIAALDYNKLFFLQSDIDDFTK